jgi:hypothetical protein
MIDEYEVVGGMRIGKGKQRKSATVPFHPPQIPRDLCWAQIRAATVGDQQLTT